jgi:hypothetical protein
MALINLKTNLLTLKYGGDKLKGGSSNQPYITTPIPGLQSDGNVASVGVEDNPPFDVLAARFPDALVRGGLLAPINAGKDVSRLTQYFFDLKSPRGLIFIANQNLLSRTAVKTEASYGAGYGGGALNEGIYLPTSTLAQVAVQGWTGTHLNKQGLNPLKPTGAFTGDSTLEDILGAGGINTYSEVMKEKKQNDIDNITLTSGTPNKYYNRLLQLHRVKIENQPLVSVRKRDRIPIDTEVNSPNILSYGGGPDSILGINNTNIRFASERTGVNNIIIKQNLEPDGYFKSTPSERSYRNSPEYNSILPKLGVSVKYRDYFYPLVFVGEVFPIGYNLENGNQDTNNPFGFKQATPNQTLSTFTPPDFKTNVLTQDQINNKKPIQDGKSTLVDDFRTKLDIEKNNTILSFSANYREDNIEQRVNLGDPGSRKDDKDRSDYTLGGTGSFASPGKNNIKNALDKITAQPIYLGSYKKTDTTSRDSDTLNNATSLNDLATFYIAAYKNDTSSNAFYIHFRAFINSFSDSYNPKWNSINYVGRGNTLYNYEGFTRDVKMSFTVAAQSKQELMPMYYKLNYLASTLAPDYTNAGFMRGTLYKMTMGAYLFETPGIITSLNYTIPEQSPWEINIGNSKTESDNSVKELPHIINVDLGFTPIQDFLPRRATEKSGKGSPFISLRNGGSTESTGNENGYNHYDKYNN